MDLITIEISGKSKKKQLKKKELISINIRGKASRKKSNMCMVGFQEGEKQSRRRSHISEDKG